MLRKRKQSGNGVIGIDIGAHGVRLVQFSPRGGPVIHAAARHAWGRQVDLADIAFHEGIGEEVAELVRGYDFSGNRVVSCLPASILNSRSTRLPMMPDEELLKAAVFEAEERLAPESGASIETRSLIAGPVHKGEEARSEVIMMAVESDLIHAHAESLIQANLEPIAIEVPPVSIARSLVEIPPEGSPIVILDIGRISTKTLIICDGQIRFFKTIDVGLNRIDASLFGVMGGDSDSGEQVRLSIDGETEETRERLVEAARPAVTQIAEEVALCLRYDSVTFRGARPETCWLSGGGVNVPGLAGTLADWCGLDPKLLDPFAGFDTEKVAGRLGDRKERSMWATAVGAARRGLKDVGNTVLKEAA